MARKSPDPRHSFFAHAETVGALDAITSAKKLTIFLGAGVARDQGIKTWTDLVEKLLSDLVTETRSDPVNVGASVAATLAARYREKATASTIEEALRERFGRAWMAERDERIRNQLYPSAEPAAPVIKSPSLAEYVLRLAIEKKINGAQVHIITTNFDDLLEQVARTSGVQVVCRRHGISVKKCLREPPSNDENVIPIVHVHGHLPRRGRAVGLVFSSRNYVDWLVKPGFDHYLWGRFREGTTLFVGYSLRDDNIANQLVSATKRREGRIFAILPLEDDVKEGLPLQYLTYPALGARHLGVTALQPNFYGQVYQFLQEATLSCGHYTTRHYYERLDTWWKLWRSSFFGNGADGRRETSKALAELAQWTRREIPLLGPVKAELWVRPGGDHRILELWSSSQSIPYTGAHYRPHRIGIDHGSRYLAVQALAGRSVLQGPIEVSADGRWRRGLSVPIVLSDPPHYEIPVGVINLLYAPRGKAAVSLTGDEELHIAAETAALGRDRLLATAF